MFDGRGLPDSNAEPLTNPTVKPINSYSVILKTSLISGHRVFDTS